ncbi:OmpH family outer membrane protein [Thioclava sp. SK-1]|uniref:OmpH family outer membrane protein n=1 Tax=Thioclava sp. SK-1 TaxID=1889770 RepID=UPI00159F1F79|nr:OmpH family outer membrane protein [Thioclava sp. SK-1]
MLLASVLLAVSSAGGAAAQDTVSRMGSPAGATGTVGAVQTPVLTVDWEQLYQQSAWAQRVRQEVAEQSAALNAENDKIAADLVEEERSLTERRASMTPENFRAAAQAFDEKATTIRTAQKNKAQALNRNFDAERQAFLQQVLPLLDRLLLARGAYAVLDRRAVVHARAEVDVTSELADLVDAELGNGAVTPPTP